MSSKRAVWPGWVVALAVGTLHYWEVSCYHHELNSLTITEQKLAALKTENAFYYSYYEETVTAPTAVAAIWGAVRDRRSEAPDTINAIHRFNIYQELFCGLLFRLACWVVGESWVPDPWYFFRSCSYTLQGFGHIALVRLTACCGGEGFRGGALPGLALATMLFLHRKDIGRIHDVGMLNLRENWAMPVILCQILALYKMLVWHPRLRCGSDPRRARIWRRWLWTFRIFTITCMLLWQFSAFAFLLQVSAVFLCTLLSCNAGTRCALADLVISHVGCTAVAALLLFGNELLVHHMLVTQCAAIWLVLRLRCNPPKQKMWFWVDGALAVMLFTALRAVQSRWATAEEHIGELFYAKIQPLFPSTLGVQNKEPTFNARLYLAVSVFDFIDFGTIKRAVPTGVYHFAVVGFIIWKLGFVRCVLLRADGHVGDVVGHALDDDSTVLIADVKTAGSHVGLRRRKPITDAPTTPGMEAEQRNSAVNRDPNTDAVGGVSGRGKVGDDSSISADFADAFGNAFLLVQLVFFLVLGCFISRLKILGAPYLCALAALALAPRPLEVAIGSAKGGSGGHRCCGRMLRAVFAAAAVLQLAQLAFLVRRLPFLESRGLDSHRDVIWADADRGELYDWMIRHVPRDEIIITSMTLSAELRLMTPFRLAIHPQFEAQSLRYRVQEIYQFYQCTPPDMMARTMRKYQSTIIVLEYRRCDFSPFMLDMYPDLNCEKGTRPWKDLFCPAAHVSPHFRLRFANSGFVVLQAHDNSTSPAQAGQTAELHIEDIKVWRPMLERCLREEPELCVSRTADLASMFHSKIGQPQLARSLLDWVREHGAMDGQAQYLLGYHSDYNLGRPEDAAGHYHKAYTLEPNNPLIVREYLMWLDVQARDNRTLEWLMRSRRAAKAERLSLLDLEDVALACEASVTAFELFRDLDWAEDLWNLATSKGIGNTCVKNNWALHNNGRSMEDDLYPWGVFLNIFWHRKLRSELVSTTSNGVRYQKPRKPWNLGVGATFASGA